MKEGMQCGLVVAQATATVEVVSVKKSRVQQRFAGRFFFFLIKHGEFVSSNT